MKSFVFRIWILMRPISTQIHQNLNLVDISFSVHQRHCLRIEPYKRLDLLYHQSFAEVKCISNKTRYKTQKLNIGYQEVQQKEEGSKRMGPTLRPTFMVKGNLVADMALKLPAKTRKSGGSA
jgi:hypothetical protein